MPVSDDRKLRARVSFVEHAHSHLKQGPHVSLVVGGLFVRGELVSPEAWLDEVRKSDKKVVDELLATPSAELRAEVERLQEWYADTDDAADFLHLRNAEVGDMSHNTRLLRLRLSSVDGWDIVLPAYKKQP
jgi:hypothetical protein